MEPLTLSQWLTFYRQEHTGREVITPQIGHQVLLVTPADQPPLNNHSKILPPIVRIVRKDGKAVIYRLMKTPRILVWGPRTFYATLYLFTVRFLHQYCRS